MAGADDLALFERLVRIEAKLDLSHTTHDDHEGRLRALEQDNVHGGHEDHEGRLRRLERSVWLFTGAAAAGGGVAGQLIAGLIK